MRNLAIYTAICKQKLEDIGIPYGNIISVEVNTRAKSRWGQCKRVANGFKININADLLDERNSEKGLEETILHELLHTCTGCMNHGENWKRLANIVNECYNYNIQTASTQEDKGVTIKSERVYKTSYIIKCTCCGHTYIRHRMNKTIQHPEQYRCGHCGGKLNRVA